MARYKIVLFSVAITDCEWATSLDRGFKTCIGTHPLSGAKAKVVVRQSAWEGYTIAFKRLTETVEFISWAEAEAKRIKHIQEQKARQDYADEIHLTLEPNGSVFTASTYKKSKKKSSKNTHKNKSKKKKPKKNETNK